MTFSVVFLILTILGTGDLPEIAFAESAQLVQGGCTTDSKGAAKSICTVGNSELPAADKSVKDLMGELKTTGTGRYKWNPILWVEEGWQVGGTSNDGRPLLYYVCGNGKNNVSLILSSVHGDEITPVYWGFRLVNFLIEHGPEVCVDKTVVVAPFVNPDGFLKKSPSRTNSHGVDLNRNFATKDFEADAMRLWKNKLKSDKRRFPGEKPASEPETLFQQELVAKYKPHKILSVHAPLNILDYDGPESGSLKEFTEEYVKSCEKLKVAVRRAASNYRFQPYGFYPGSLGNYAGRERGIPTFTLELPSIDYTKGRLYFDTLKKGTLAFINEQILENPLTKN